MKIRWERPRHSAARRRWRVAAAALAVMVVGTVTGLAPTSPAMAAVPGSITGPGGKCIDITAGATWNGARLQLWTCNGQPWQDWYAFDDGTIHSNWDGKCMDVSGGGTAIGTPVQVWDCNGTGAQQWVRMGGVLFNPQSGKCLDSTQGGTSDGTPLQIWYCNGTAAQQWTLSLNTHISLPPGTGSAELLAGFCLSASGGSLGRDSCNPYSDSGQERFLFTHLSDDSYLIWNQLSGLCITPLVNPGTTRGRLVMAPCNQPNQAWWIIPSGFSPEQFKLQSTSLPNTCMSTWGGPTWSSCYATSLDDQSLQIWKLV